MNTCMPTYIHRDRDIYVGVHIYISHIWMEVFYNWGFLYVYNLWSCWPRNNKALKESAMKMIYLFFKCAAKMIFLMSHWLLPFFKQVSHIFWETSYHFPHFVVAILSKGTPSWLVVIDLPATLLIPTEQLGHTGMLWFKRNQLWASISDSKFISQPPELEGLRWEILLNNLPPCLNGDLKIEAKSLRSYWSITVLMKGQFGRQRKERGTGGEES